MASKEVAVRGARGVARKLELDETAGKQYAMAVALAKSAAVPMEYIGKPDKIFSTLEYGRELGVAPMLALANIANIKGRPSMSTNLQLGLCMKRKDWAGYKIEKSDETVCKVVVYRVVCGERFAYPGSFSFEDAKKAGLWSAGSSWDKYRKQMLKMRATAFALRDAFPDVVTGVYSIEEMDPERAAQEYERVIDDGSVIVEAGEVLEGKGQKAEVRVDVSKPKNKVAPGAKKTMGRKPAARRR